MGDEEDNLIFSNNEDTMIKSNAKQECKKTEENRLLIQF